MLVEKKQVISERFICFIISYGVFVMEFASWVVKNLLINFGFSSSVAVLIVSINRGFLKTNLYIVRFNSISVTYSPDGKMIYSGGHWDNSVRGYSVAERRTLFHRLWHSGRVGIFQNLFIWRELPENSLRGMDIISESIGSIWDKI